MKIKLSTGKIRGSGLFIVSGESSENELELVLIKDGWVFDYPNMKTSIPIEKSRIYGWKKIDILCDYPK
jgi:hypothetical protein